MLILSKVNQHIPEIKKRAREREIKKNNKVIARGVEKMATNNAVKVIKEKCIYFKQRKLFFYYHCYLLNLFPTQLATMQLWAAYNNKSNTIIKTHLSGYNKNANYKL